MIQRAITFSAVARLIPAILVAAIVFSLAGTSYAIRRDWDNGAASSDDWFATANWDPDGTPASTDHLYIGTYTHVTNVAKANAAVTADNSGSIMVTELDTDTVVTFKDSLNIGVNGSATFYASDGVNIVCTKNVWTQVADKTGSQGTVTVTDPGTTWNSDYGICVGDSGWGRLFIKNGGQMTNSHAYVGYRTSGSYASIAEIDGNNSKWTLNGSSGTLWVGRQGYGKVEIKDGGLVETKGGVIGETSNANGKVVLTGAGSTWHSTATDIQVGGDLSPGGTGVLNLGAGTTVDVDYPNYPWKGKVIVYNGTGTLKGRGTIDGNVENHGETLPGGSTGTLHILCDYTQFNTGHLRIELGGTGLGQFDVLDVGGLVTLAGALDVTQEPGYIPSAGDSFDILDWGSRSGTFGSENLPLLGGGLYWDKSALYTSGVISIVPEPGTLALLAAAGLGLLLFAWRRRK